MLGPFLSQLLSGSVRGEGGDSILLLKSLGRKFPPGNTQGQARCELCSLRSESWRSREGFPEEAFLLCLLEAELGGCSLPETYNLVCSSAKGFPAVSGDLCASYGNCLCPQKPCGAGVCSQGARVNTGAVAAVVGRPQVPGPPQVLGPPQGAGPSTGAGPSPGAGPSQGVGPSPGAGPSPRCWGQPSPGGEGAGNLLGSEPTLLEPWCPSPHSFPGLGGEAALSVAMESAALHRQVGFIGIL